VIELLPPLLKINAAFRLFSSIAYLFATDKESIFYDGVYVIFGRLYSGFSRILT
jgi:hypothetical protein